MNARKSAKQPYVIQGVDLLFGLDTEEGDQPNNVQFIALKDIELPSRQPRRYFDPQKQASLVESIREHGILQPLIVRPSPQKKGKYELVAGERRYRAGMTLELELAPIIIRILTDDQASLLALLENLQREDLNPVEETEAILQLIESKAQMSVEQITTLLNSAANKERQSVHNVIHSEQWQDIEAIFAALGKFTPNSFRVNRLPLLKLPETILRTLREGKIEYTKAQAIAKVKNEEKREELLQQVLKENLSLTEIKERIINFNFQENNPSSLNPQKELSNTYQRLKQSQLWKKNPKKWQKLQTLLKKIEALIDEDEEKIF